jgi:hypothetical protein
MTRSADVELFEAGDGVTLSYRRWLPDAAVRAAAQVIALARLMEKRDEVFNETNRDEVVTDLVRWLEHGTDGQAL